MGATMSDAARLSDERPPEGLERAVERAPGPPSSGKPATF
jgi:hypothetical protein